MYKKCLVPLDGSELAECALNHVKNLVKEKSVGEVTLLNVVKVDIPWAEINEKTLDLEATQETALRRRPGSISRMWNRGFLPRAFR